MRELVDCLKKEDASDVIGVYPLLSDDTCRFIVFDFDNHEKGAEENVELYGVAWYTVYFIVGKI